MFLDASPLIGLGIALAVLLVGIVPYVDGGCFRDN